MDPAKNHRNFGTPPKVGLPPYQGNLHTLNKINMSIKLLSTNRKIKTIEIIDRSFFNKGLNHQEKCCCIVFLQPVADRVKTPFIHIFTPHSPNLYTPVYHVLSLSPDPRSNQLVLLLPIYY